MDHTKYKHISSFKLSALKENAPSEYHMGRLLVRKKRRRPKIAPETLEHVEHDYDYEDDDSYDAVNPFGTACMWIVFLIS